MLSWRETRASRNPAVENLGEAPRSGHAESMYDVSVPLLGDEFPLPVERPFTTGQAQHVGLDGRALGRLLRVGLIRRIVRGVLVANQVPDSIQLRCQAVALVTPCNAVVTDTTAGWLHGAEMVLAPNAHLHTVRVACFHRTPGCRSRASFCDSGERTMPHSDVTEIGGLLVTTRLRSALDMGRLLPRDRALAALDAMLRIGGFEVDDLCAGAERFKGFRGVRQLRSLAPVADGRSQSPGESALRLHWLDALDLPRPRPQVPVPGPAGQVYYLDLGVEELRFAAEYDGLEWHGPDRAAYDAARREWISRSLGWEIAVFTKEHVFGPRADAGIRLRGALREARASFGRRQSAA